MPEATDPAAQAAAAGGTPAPKTPPEGQQPEGQVKGQQTDPAGETAPGATPEPSRVPWYNKRIDTLTARLKEQERENAALKAQISPPSDPPAPDIDSLVQQRAREYAAQQRIDEAANRTYNAGKTKYQDFDLAVHGVRAAGEITQQFVDAVTRLPNAEDVYYHLGKNPDAAAHLLSLDPVPMALELAQMSAKLGKPKPVSQAPAPTTPVGGSTQPQGLSDDLPIDEWMRRREAELQR